MRVAFIAVCAWGVCACGVPLPPVDEPHPELVAVEGDVCYPARFASSRGLSLFVSNDNARHIDGHVVADSDADGLTDVDEEQFLTDPAHADTDGDGFLDKAELMLSTVGLDPFVDEGLCRTGLVDDRAQAPDTDRDRLSDCDERIMRTFVGEADTDRDGSLDGDEVRAGSNFLLDNALTDSDFDGMADGEELALHREVRQSDDDALAYRYLVDPVLDPVPGVFVEPTPREGCAHFRVENISLAATLSGDNHIRVVLIDAGFILLHGPTDDVFERFTHHTTAGVDVHFEPGTDGEPARREPADDTIWLGPGDFR